MTLFKKVFGNEAVDGGPEQSDDMHAEDLDTLEEVDSDIVTRLARVAERKGTRPEDRSDVSESEHRDQPPADADERSDDSRKTDGDAIGDAFEPSEPEGPHEQTLAERAAEAHRQMQMSQQRTVSRKDLSNPAHASVEDEEPTPSNPLAAPECATPEPEKHPQPMQRAGRRARTRLLGFSDSDDVQNDPFARAGSATETRSQKFPVGWFVITDGPGRGNWFAVFDGVTTIGRGEDQTVTLDFGDLSISRQNHATFAYDNEQNSYYLGHGGKSNIIRLNDRPVLSTEDMVHADSVRIGETTLRFVAMCDDGFNWKGL